MHILFVTNWFPSTSDLHSGIFVIEHAKAIELFDDVTLLKISLEFSKKVFPWNTEINHESAKEVHLKVSIPTTRFGIDKLALRNGFKKAVSIINERKAIHIVHINVRNNITKYFLDIVGKIPVVVSEHYSFYQYGIKQLPEKCKKQAIASISKWFNDSKVKLIMPVSDNLAKVLIDDFKISKKKMRVVSNVVPDYFKTGDSKGRVKPNILMVAKWEAPKNPLLFARSILLMRPDKIKNLSIDIIGEGSQLDLMKDYLSRELPGLNIKYHGMRSKEYIAEMMRSASFLVHPTDFENSPAVIAEAVCCGLPVISMQINGIAEIIDDKNGILVPPKNEEKLKLAIEDLMDNLHNYDPIEISQSAKKKYSPEIIGKQISDLYKSVVS